MGKSISMLTNSGIRSLQCQVYHWSHFYSPLCTIAIIFFERKLKKS